MPQLKVSPHAADSNGRIIHITPESAAWDHVGFDVYRLSARQILSQQTGNREACLVLVSGSADIRAGEQQFNNIGGRNSPFEQQPPGAVYLPSNTPFTVTPITDIELAICSAPTQGNHPIRLIPGSEMSQEVRGQGTNTRYVRNILPDNLPWADSLLVVEVITPSGHWSSYPPHKHDTDALPTESYLEETYYHRLNPPQGFAFQRVYTDDRSLDETISVENGDVVMVPRGYHPVGAPHGYELYYLNVMAGPARKWVFKNDPEHEWMLKT